MTIRPIAGLDPMALWRQQQEMDLQRRQGQHLSAGLGGIGATLMSLGTGQPAQYVMPPTIGAGGGSSMSLADAMRVQAYLDEKEKDEAWRAMWATPTQAAPAQPDLGASGLPALPAGVGTPPANVANLGASGLPAGPGVAPVTSAAGAMGARTPAGLPPLSPGQRAALGMMGAEEGAQALAQMMLQPKPPTTHGGFYVDPVEGWKAIPGYQEAIIAQRRAGRPSTTVNVGPSGVDYGDPPKDMAWARGEGGQVLLEPDPNTGYMRPVAVPVGGGPVEEERAEAAKAEMSRRQQSERTADIVTQDIDEIFRIMEDSPLPVTGLWSLVADLPIGSPQGNVKSLLDSVRANVGFDKLQQMRAASPTGGALGQVSERENVLLQSALGSLEQLQTDGQFRRNLQRVRDIYEEIVNPPLDSLTPDQLEKVDPTRLSDDQLEEYIALLDEATP